jgi:hypothetical protein
MNSSCQETCVLQWLDAGAFIQAQAVCTDDGWSFVRSFVGWWGQPWVLVHLTRLTLRVGHR